MKKKRFIMVFVIAIIVFGTTVAFAARPNPPNLLGDKKEITQVIETKTGSVTIEVVEYRQLAREVFDLVNEERLLRNLPPVVWNEQLYQPAIIRAVESSQSFSHTRPNGRNWSTVSPLVQAENLSWNPRTPKAVMMDWMNSNDHLHNILNKELDGMAVACIDTSSGPYWVQLFSSPASFDIETLKPQITSTPNGVSGMNTATDKNPDKSSSITKQTPVELDGTQILSELQQAKETGKVEIQSKDVHQVSSDTIGKINQWSTQTGRSVLLVFNTTQFASNEIHSRFALDAKALSALTKTVDVTIRSDSPKAIKTKFDFESWFENKVAVVTYNQPNGIGVPVELTVLVDLSALNKENLLFYDFDSYNNTYKRNKDIIYQIDENGYLHFIMTGEAVIITDSPLVSQ